MFSISLIKTKALLKNKQHCYIAGASPGYSVPIHWLVHDYVTSNNELFPAKCHGQATLQKL